MKKTFGAIIFCSSFFTLVAGLSPQDVRNNASNVLYNDVLVEPLVKSLTDIVSGARVEQREYVPDDVALVQTISTLQETLFQLAKFYADREEGTQITRYGGGIAIEFESQRCDNVYSSKFPRTILGNQPWRFYKDSSYYQLRCEEEVQVQTRSRREITNHALNEVVNVEDSELSMKKRRRRAAAPSVFTRNGPLCGDTYFSVVREGNLLFPSINGTSRNYTSNVICVWTIEASIKYAIQLNFTWINTEWDKNCKFDSLEFFEGADEHAERISITCGTGRFIVRSKKNFIAIKFKSDDNVHGRGFNVTWSMVDPVKGHPGFVLSSTIVVDQVGDLNIDKTRVNPEEEGDFDFKIDKNFKLKLTKPSTCPKISDDPDCYFETTPYIISKLIATGMGGKHMKLPSKAIEILFDHVVVVDAVVVNTFCKFLFHLFQQTDLYPDLYQAPKYCVTWDSGVKETSYGSWTRKGGKLIESDVDRSICQYSIHGIHALAAAVPPPVVPDAFRFTLSWYCGLIFTIVWVTFTFLLVTTSAINIPDWLNLNQLLSLVVFCGIVLSGMHLELHQLTCSILSFLLYYFGLAVFNWHLLKAAQFTGVLDKFFRRERNLYAFYLILGWCVPLFIAGMAAGAKLHIRERSQSCWFAMKGGTIWGYTSPTYFIVLAILYLYYKGLKKTKERLAVYNYPRLRNRAVRDIVALVLFLLTWLSGIICMTNETEFAPQYLFSFFLCLTVVVLCVAAKQQRRSFEKVYDYEDPDDHASTLDENRNFLDNSDNEDDDVYEQELLKKYGKRWLYNPPPTELRLALKINSLENSTIKKYYGKFEIIADESNKWNNMYTAANIAYEDEEEDEEEEKEKEEENAHLVEDALREEDEEEEDEEEEEEEDQNSDEEEESDIDQDDDNGANDANENVNDFEDEQQNPSKKKSPEPESPPEDPSEPQNPPEDLSEPQNLLEDSSEPQNPPEDSSHSENPPEDSSDPQNLQADSSAPQELELPQTSQPDLRNNELI